MVPSVCPQPTPKPWGSKNGVGAPRTAQEDGRGSKGDGGRGGEPPQALATRNLHPAAAPDPIHGDGYTPVLGAPEGPTGLSVCSAHGDGSLAAPAGTETMLVLRALPHCHGEDERLHPIAEQGGHPLGGTEQLIAPN